MQEKSLRLNTIINILRSILSILFPLITFKYASVILGSTGIGIANFSQSVVAYFQLFATFGITTYAVAEGAKLRSDKVRFQQFASEIFTLNIITTLISFSAMLLMSVFGLFGDYNIYIYVLSSTLLFNLIGFEWMFTVFEQFLYITLRSLLFQILSLILLFILVKDKNDLLIYVGLIAFATGGSSVFNFYKSKEFFRLEISPIKSLKRHWMPLLVIFGTSIASLIYVNSDIILLGIISGNEAVGVYSAGVKIVKAVCVPIASVGLVVVPRIAERIAQGNIKEVEAICNKAMEFMCFFIFPFAIGLFLLSKEAILLLSSPDFLNGSIVIQLLLLDLFLSPINGFLVSQLLVPFGKQNVSFWATIFGALGNIFLDLLMIPIFSIYGAAIATIAAELIVFLICVPCLKQQINLWVIVKGIWQYFVAALLIIPIFLFVEQFDMGIIISSVLTILIGGFAYVIALRMMNNIVLDTLIQMIDTKLNLR